MRAGIVLGQGPRSPSAISSALGIAGLGTAVVGLGASLSSAVDYFAPAPAFCGDSGCATVKDSVFAHVLGVPTPAVGIGFFSLAIVLSLATPLLPSVAERARRPIAAAGGAVGIALVLVQAFAIQSWCKLCLFADVAGIAHALVVLAGAPRLRLSWRSAAPILPATAGVMGALALITRPAPEPPVPIGVPDVVAKEQHATSDDARTEVTVVEFVDFECPFCRDMQARLNAAIEEVPHRVRVVRKMTPLPQHAGAMPAAIAWCCAEEQGRGDEMADALFSAPTEDLTPEGCARMAECIGLDMDRYHRAAADPGTHARVAGDLADASAAGVHRLPTLFVGTERITGAAKSATELAAMIDEAARSNQGSSTTTL